MTTTGPRRFLIAALSASALSIPLVCLDPAVAAAENAPCDISGFTPTSVTVGLSPKAVTFKPTVDNCSLQGWDILGGDFLFFVYDDAPGEVFSPYDSADAKAHDVVVTAYNSDYVERVLVFPKAFTLKRNTGWDKFNASPEPVEKGSKITVKGRLRVADWTNDEYDGYSQRGVSLEFRPKNSSTYTKVKSVKTGKGGYASTTVTATRDGYWRYRYFGNPTAGRSTIPGDFVDVR